MVYVLLDSAADLWPVLLCILVKPWIWKNDYSIRPCRQYFGNTKQYFGNNILLTQNNILVTKQTYAMRLGTYGNDFQ